MGVPKMLKCPCAVSAPRKYGCAEVEVRLEISTVSTALGRESVDHGKGCVATSSGHIRCIYLMCGTGDCVCLCVCSAYLC